MQKDTAHNRWWQTSEVVFGVPFLAAIVLQLVVPLKLSFGPFSLAIITLGVAIFILGVVFIVKARREFSQHGQRTDPGYPTTNIVTTGVFSLSRNPLYVGVVFVLIGIALAFNLLWALVLLLPSLVACHYVLIAPEEKYLTAKFGEEYLRYAASVHRWLGRLRRQE